MGYNLGDTFPNFQAEAFGHDGTLDFYEFLDNQWGILFSHPADYTPVCTTELAKAADMVECFKKRNCKILGLSCNDKTSHEGWCKDICQFGRVSHVPYPIIADTDRNLANKLGIMDPNEKDRKGLPLTCRSVFFISPAKKVLSLILYPATTGRSFDEILRVLDSLQLTSTYPVATPEGWKCGQKCIVDPKIADDEVTKRFPKGVVPVPLPSGKNYLRITPDPRC